MNKRKYWFQWVIGFGLLVILAGSLALLLRYGPTSVRTGQVSAPPIDVVQVKQQGAPVPTALIISTVYPTETPLPTVPLPSTPTLIPGPSATPIPISTPASDATGLIVYVVGKTESKPGQDVNIAVYSVLVDKAGQPQGKPVQKGNGIQVSGFFALHPSPDGRQALITDGWGVHSLLNLESGQIDSPFRKNVNPMGMFFGWHPDSHQILMRAEQNYSDVGLWLLNTNTGKHITLLAPYPSPGALTSGAVSPDGQRVI